MNEERIAGGPGSIGQAIARRVSVGKHVLLVDLREENAAAAAKTLSDAGYEVSTATVDISSRDSIQALVERATAIGPVMGMIHAAGVSSSQASPATIETYRALMLSTSSVGASESRSKARPGNRLRRLPHCRNF